MATEQQHGSHEQQDSHDGGSPSEAPESGAMGSRQNESRQSEQRGGQDMQRQGGSGSQGMARGHAQSGLSRSSGFGQSGPFSLMRRISEDMDRLFEGFFGPSLLGSRSPLGASNSLFEGQSPFGLARSGQWPEIDVHQEGDRLVILADVPGLSREDVRVEVQDQRLVISGERRTQNERREGGFYHSERSYGSFSRAIPLPENANLESASASFENGVLRVEIEAPDQQQSRGRRVEIREGRPQ